MTNEQKQPHFSREYTVTYRTKTGNEYTEKVTYPQSWDHECFVETEIREKLWRERWLMLEGWEVNSDQIEAWKIEMGKITKSLYPDYRNVKPTEDDLIALGFEGEELLKELGHDF